MSNAVYFVSYKLKKDASVQDFLLAAEKLNNEYMSKQKGYISWKQLLEGEMWADLLTFETMEDAQKISNPSEKNDLAEKFYSFINLNSCKVHIFTVEKSY
ncbi:MAG: hypothetical protein LBU70_00275 [Chitinispirillales bacterium]|jgi:hypothetical protein|nr:hypothetical protein [Chitinispirillales bacterium]